MSKPVKKIFSLHKQQVLKKHINELTKQAEQTDTR